MGGFKLIEFYIKFYKVKFINMGLSVIYINKKGKE